MFKTLENRYTFLLWWAIFLFILPWDQEKIVVINLIVFCYFLYYMVSDSMEEFFDEKKQEIRNVMLFTINKRLKALANIESEVLEIKRFMSNFVFSVIKKYLSNRTGLNKITEDEKSFTRKSNQILFLAVNFQLENLTQNNKKTDLNKNIIAANSFLNNKAAKS